MLGIVVYRLIAHKNFQFVVYSLALFLIAIPSHAATDRVRECDNNLIGLIEENIVHSKFALAYDRVKSFRTKSVKKMYPVSTNISIQTIIKLCMGHDGHVSQHGFLFKFDEFGFISAAENHHFLSGYEAFEKFPFSGVNYVSSENAIVAAKRFLQQSSLVGFELKTALLNRHFFVHSDVVMANSLREIVFIREPYQKSSLISQIGGNSSPNFPVGLCLRFSINGTEVIEFVAIRGCKFNWSTYTKQVNEFLLED